MPVRNSYTSSNSPIHPCSPLLPFIPFYTYIVISVLSVLCFAPLFDGCLSGAVSVNVVRI